MKKAYKEKEIKMTQKENVRKYLEDGHTITPLGALQRFGAFRLSAIIYELRKEGMPIKTFLRTKNDKTFAEYYLPEFYIIYDLNGKKILDEVWLDFKEFDRQFAFVKMGAKYYVIDVEEEKKIGTLSYSSIKMFRDMCKLQGITDKESYLAKM